MTEIVFENATARIGVLRNVVVVRWADAPRTTAELHEFEKAGKRVAAEYDKRAAFANVIVSGTPVFSQQVRDEVTRLTRQSMFTLGTTQIILVQGFAGVAVRAFLNTSLLVSRTKTPNKVCGDVATGVAWMDSRLREGPVAWTRGDLDAFVNRVLEARGETMQA